MKFKIHSEYGPAGGQKEAIASLVKGYNRHSMQTLLGITGSGKTFVMANVIEQIQKPTLILAHNKTLAAQLYQELRELFPENRVEYFVSYYDYYQPESYMPTSDTYIEKEATVNEEIEKMRLRAMSGLLSREDVIVVASISCIYGAGNPNDFKGVAVDLEVGKLIGRRDIITHLVEMQYQRNDNNLSAGNFRVRGDVVDIFLAYDKSIIRIELFGNKIEKISELHHVTLDVLNSLDKITLYPAKQFVVPEEKVIEAHDKILSELKVRLTELPLLESERLKKRVMYDLEMINEMGYCTGIENYSRHFDGRKKGMAPFCLLDYFPEDFMIIIDESHQSIPQSNAMYKGDLARKKNLVEYGFRLPSAYDNRPLKFSEFEKYFKHAIFVSATPADYEIKNSGNVVNLIIRPTGLLDPLIEVRSTKDQIKDLIIEIRKVVAKNERILVTTLTKKMAEDLTDYLAKEEIRVRYMHSEIESLDRIELVRGLRAGDFDVLVGINLLREGLDIPEVSLVAILDADKEGFLRNQRSLIQTTGRAARNVNGRVIMYAERITDSMKSTIEITHKRRQDQITFNKKHSITPKTIIKSVMKSSRIIKGMKHLGKTQLKKKLVETEMLMKKAAEELDFEKAIDLRDYLKALENEIK